MTASWRSHRTARGIDRGRWSTNLGYGNEDTQMAEVTGLLIFAAVIGSHVFLWWSCHRNGGSPRI